MAVAPLPLKISIGHVIRCAAVFNFWNWRGGSANADSLPATVTRLFELLHERCSERFGNSFSR